MKEEKQFKVYFEFDIEEKDIEVAEKVAKEMRDYVAVNLPSMPKIEVTVRDN